MLTKAVLARKSRQNFGRTNQRLPPGGISRRSRVSESALQYSLCKLKSRRLLPSRSACHLPPGGRLCCSTIQKRSTNDHVRTPFVVGGVSPTDLFDLNRSYRRQQATALRCSLNVIQLYCKHLAVLLFYFFVGERPHPFSNPTSTPPFSA